jgi:probable rRNA maturation factor
MITVEVEIADPAWTAAVPRVASFARQAAKAVDGQGAAAILLADNARVQDLNARFRGKDAPTNVLSFPAGPNPVGHLGDLVLAFEVCETEARDQGKQLADHLRHLVVHGLLHLLGYDHEDEAEGDLMEALEREILGGIGVPDPYGDASQDRSPVQP